MAKSGVGTRIVSDLADNRSGHHPTFARRHLDSDRLAIATHNPGKLAEMRELVAPYGIAAISAGELGLVEPDESGMTFGENARIKAASRRWPTIRGLLLTRSMARPEFTRRAGRARIATFTAPWK